MWLIGKGSIKYWKDKWHDHVLYFLNCPFPNISVKEAFSNEFLLNEYTNQLEGMDNFKFSEHKDKFICTLNVKGCLNVSSIYSAIRPVNPSFAWLKNCWNPFIPAKMSLFLWKVIHKAVPTDVSCQANMVAIVSKCNCCSVGHIEGINHLFCFSDIAITIWSFFSSVLGISISSTNFNGFIDKWMLAGSHHSQVGNIIFFLGYAIPWSIWLFRNNKRFGDRKDDIHGVMRRIYSSIHGVCCLMKPVYKLSFNDAIILDILGVRPRPVVGKRGIWVKWAAPLVGQFKLNTDGACSNNNCWGEGYYRTLPVT